MSPAAAGLAVLAGLLLFSGHPPLDVAAAGPLALVPLLAALRTTRHAPHPARSGAALGLLAGVVFFGLLLTWIWRFGVVAWVLLVGVQAAFLAVFGAIVATWGARRGRTAVVVIAWAALEVLRSQVPFSGFPWGVLGATQHDGGPLLPVARLGGVIALGAVLVLLAVAVESVLTGLASRRRARRRAPPGPSGTPASAPAGSLRGALTVAAVALAVTVIVVASVPGPPPSTGRTIDIAGVQGNDIELPPVVDRLNRVRIEQVVERMSTATRELIEDPPPDLTVWPENSLDNDYRTDTTLARLVDEARAAIDDAPLVAGTLLDGPRPATAYNAFVLIGADGDVRDTYVKRVLVPFGEYVPWRSLLGWFPPLQQIPVDYLPGEGPGLFRVDGALVGPVACFESIFARYVHDQVRAGAQVLVVSTNNASFGRSAASRQHLAFSQVRAVETGRYILHAGISGISAVVAPDGSLSQRTGLFEQAVIRADLPLVDATTPATTVIPWVHRIALAGGGIILVLLALRGRAALRRESSARAR